MPKWPNKVKLCQHMIYDALYFYEAANVTCAVSKLVHTVLSSEFKDILTPTQKNHKQHNVNHGGGIKKNIVSQNQQMIDQKNGMDRPIAEHHPPENEVDFELLCLWRCISKIQNQFGMAMYTKEIEINNKEYNYSELTDVFDMFI